MIGGPQQPGKDVSVLVTGANRGLGLALTLELARRGAQVIACSRSPSAAAHLPAAVEQHELDVADHRSIGRLADLLNGRPLDILINNAAIRGDTGGLQTLVTDDFLAVMRVNALGPLLMARAFLGNLLAGRRKIVANISSRVGSLTTGMDGDGDYAYRCSKAALNMATVKLAADYEQHGLTVLSLHPGWVQTAMGGPEAPVPVAASAEGLVDVILGATPADTGTFRSFDGSAIAW